MMRNASRRALCGLLALCVLLACSACSDSAVIDTPSVSATLPPAAARYEAPAGDGDMTYVASLPLYLPSRDGKRLIARLTDVPLDHSAPAARDLVQALLTAPADDSVLSLGRGEVSLQGYSTQPVELSAGVCTVNLGSQALALESSSLYAVAHALASTLAAAGDIRAVNLLVADQAVSYDVAGNLPSGSVSARPGEELAALWDALDARRTPLGQDPATVPLSATATLYFPLEGGQGFMPETRNLTFSGQTPQQLALGLLSALSAGPQYLSPAMDMPALTELLTREPEVSELPEGGRLITLVFDEALAQWISEVGMEPSCLCASLVWTLTTFIPSVGAVRMIIGSTMTTLLQSEVMGHLNFENGLMRRRHFRDGLKEQLQVYLRSGSRLTGVTRVVNAQDALNPRVMLTQLIRTPTAAELDEGLASPLPEGLDETDILGVSAEEDTLLINLSPRFETLLRRQPELEQVACYAMLVTLCENLGYSRARFYFTGQQRERLGGDLYWAGEFLLNRALIDDNRG